jgi:hypothetical protein
MLLVPRDMKSIEPFGDYLRHGDAYGSRDFSIMVVYDLLLPEATDESHKLPLYSCERQETGDD